MIISDIDIMNLKYIKPTGSTVTEMSVSMWIKNTLVSGRSFLIHYSTDTEFSLNLHGPNNNKLEFYIAGAFTDGPVGNLECKAFITISFRFFQSKSTRKHRKNLSNLDEIMMVHIQFQKRSIESFQQSV